MEGHITNENYSLCYYHLHLFLQSSYTHNMGKIFCDKAWLTAWLLFQMWSFSCDAHVQTSEIVDEMKQFSKFSLLIFRDEINLLYDLGLPLVSDTIILTHFKPIISREKFLMGLTEIQNIIRTITLSRAFKTFVRVRTSPWKPQAPKTVELVLKK